MISDPPTAFSYPGSWQAFGEWQYLYVTRPGCTPEYMKKLRTESKANIRRKIIQSSAPFVRDDMGQALLYVAPGEELVSRSMNSNDEQLGALVLCVPPLNPQTSRNI